MKLPKDKESGQGRRCPKCGSDVARDSEHYPFCSDRCRLADLGQWFSGEYTLSRPVEERDLDESS